MPRDHPTTTAPGVLNLRLSVPPAHSEAVQQLLRDDTRVTNVVVLPGAAVDPPGDAVFADVAREAASELIGRLDDLGLGRDGAISVTDVDGSPYRAARRAESSAPGSPDDGVVWRLVEERAWSDSRGSVSFYAFLVIAVALASVAVITDSSVLVVGAMVVGPEFGPVAAVATGIVLRRPPLVGRSLRLLAVAFPSAIAIVAGVSLLGRWAGWVTAEMVTRPHPLTGFIWHPDRWSLVVALLAGIAGVLSLTTGKSSALVGVFISVTTVPAAGNLALSLAVGARAEMLGSVLMLVLNLIGMAIAGTVTLLVQRLLWRHVPTWRVGRPSSPARSS